jgi:putative ABC transport system permease protein
MTWRTVLRRFGIPAGWSQDERELREDVAHHLDMSAAAYRRAGHSPEEADRLARVKFGGTERVVEAVHDAAGGRRLADVIADVRFGLRLLARRPGFTLTAIVSLSLGIGASAAMFGIVHTVLLRPLPYPDAEQLVQVMVDDTPEEYESSLSQIDVEAVTSGPPIFAASGAAYPEYAGFSVVTAGGAEQVRGSWVSPGALVALAVAPQLGRGIRAEDGRPGAEPVVLLSDGYWRSRLAGSPGVIGTGLRVHGETRTVVGVMPPGFRLPGFTEEDLWLVPQFEPATARAPFFLLVYARLAPGKTIEAANAELVPVARAVAQSFPGAHASWRYAVLPMREVVVRQSRATIWMLAGAVTLVMLIAVVNVATLVVVRTTTREAELAIRTAIGAGRGRIARQLLTESALLSIAGAIGALLIALLCLYFVERAAGDVLPRLHEIAMSGQIVAVVLGLSAVAGLVIGTAALMRIGGAAATWLRTGTRSASDTRRAGRSREIFVVLEFGLALTVLVGAVLLVASLRRLEDVDAGIRPHDVLAVRLSLPRADYQEMDRTLAFYRELERRVAARPGVQSTAVTMALPPDRLVMTNPARDASLPIVHGENVQLVEELLVTPDYFRTLGIPLRTGRGFTDGDRAESPQVAIVNEELARRFFPGRNPIGARLQLGNPDPRVPAHEIIGIAADVKYQGLDAPPEPTVYVPYAQNAWWRTMYLVVRTTGDPLRLVAGVREDVGLIDPRIPLQEVSTVDAMLHDSVRAPRLRSRALLAFAAVSLVLAMTGIYGIMAFVITQRMREMSIRMALGARASDVVRLVLQSGARLAAVGSALGLAGALASGQVMERFVFGVRPTDLRVLLLSTLLLMAAAVAATIGPAWRASRARPAAALQAG